jgi:hypothetical protein
MGEGTLNVDELFVCSYVFVSMNERATRQKTDGVPGACLRNKECLIAFQTLARIHDEAIESGDSSDFGVHHHVDAGADERSNNSCEENKYETCPEGAG